MNDDLKKQAKIIIIDIKCHWTMKKGRQKNNVREGRNSSVIFITSS